MDICRLSSKPPTVCIRPSMACFWRTAVIPMPWSTESAEPPDASMSLSPSMNAFIAEVGSDSQVFVKSSAVMWATSAIICSDSLAESIEPESSSNVSSASDAHASVNSSADLPARLAKMVSWSPPSCTAALMASKLVSMEPPAAATAVSKKLIVREIAVPAASAFCPVLAMLLDHASKSDADMPTMLPIEPMRSAMLTISDSVDAPLLPRRTSASEKPS